MKARSLQKSTLSSQERRRYCVRQYETHLTVRKRRSDACIHYHEAGAWASASQKVDNRGNSMPYVRIQSIWTENGALHRSYRSEYGLGAVAKARHHCTHTLLNIDVAALFRQVLALRMSWRGETYHRECMDPGVFFTSHF